METRPGDVRANAYDMVINGVEVGGGSIRIHDTALQQRMLKCLGFSPEQAEKQFGPGCDDRFSVGDFGRAIQGIRH